MTNAWPRSGDDVALEQWCFTCRRCGHSWGIDYEVRRGSDRAGGELVSWRRGGLPCTAPWSGARCPRCSGLRVQILPANSVPLAESR